MTALLGAVAVGRAKSIFPSILTFPGKGSAMRMLLASTLAVSIVSLAARADDTRAPVIVHTPVTSAPEGGVVAVLAKITDESKFFPQVFYRRYPADTMLVVLGEVLAYAASGRMFVTNGTSLCASSSRESAY